MKKVFRMNKIRFIVGLALTGLLCVAFVLKDAVSTGVAGARLHGESS